MTQNVTEWPLVDIGLPLPAWAVARKGVLEIDGKQVEVLALVTELEGQVWHVDAMEKGTLSGGFAKQNLRAMLNNLGGAVFEHLHPGRYMEIIREQARAAAEGREMKPELRTLWNVKKHWSGDSLLDA